MCEGGRGAVAMASLVSFLFEVLSHQTNMNSLKTPGIEKKIFAVQFCNVFNLRFLIALLYEGQAGPISNSG